MFLREIVDNFEEKGMSREDAVLKVMEQIFFEGRPIYDEDGTAVQPEDYIMEDIIESLL